MDSKRSQPVRIVIADDHPIFRDGLRRLLESEPDLKVIGEASDGAEAVKLARTTKTRNSSSRSGHAQASGIGSIARK